MVQRATTEPYTQEFTATVFRSAGREIVLNRTFFYAESGGQPSDQGWIEGIPIEEIRDGDDGPIHVLTSNPDLEEGARITGRIDPQFRSYCMRAHTASHIVYGAGRLILDELGYGGFDIGDRKIRMDLETSTTIDDRTLVELERLSNEAVWESRPVRWEIVSADTARKRDDVAFNLKTESTAFTGDAAVRLVSIDSATVPVDSDRPPTWDVAACGGTHVRNTREIGPIAVTGRSNPGEGLTRIELCVGPFAIDRNRDIHSTVRSGASRLNTKPTGLSDSIDELSASLAQATERINELSESVIDFQVSRLSDSIFDRGNSTWLVGEISGVDSKLIADRVRSMTGDVADIVVIATGDGETMLATGSKGSLDASAFVSEITSSIGGGGGGTESFAQAGGIPEDPSSIISMIRNGDFS